LINFFIIPALSRKYPLAYVTSKPRAMSDHVPLILNFRIDEIKKPSLFRFKKWWLTNPDFNSFVTKTWKSDCIFTDPIEI
jgi:hypothetical protein